MNDHDKVIGILKTGITMTPDAATGPAVPARYLPAGTPVEVTMPETGTDELWTTLPGTRFAAFVPWHDIDPNA